MSASQVSAAIDVSPIESILQASLLVQVTLGLLIILSIVCWAIAITKWRSFSKIKKSNDLFSKRFYKTQSFDSLAEDHDEFGSSPLASMFNIGYTELKKLLESKALSEMKKNNSEVPENLSNNLKVLDLETFDRTLRQAQEVQVYKLESWLSLLATTGSTGPFIGLFGTVWGIMSSFQKIGITGNASLAVVAPGISEALIATAIGLAAAIPAVVLYNHFLVQIRRLEIEMSNFSSDFSNIVKRNFSQE